MNTIVVYSRYSIFSHSCESELRSEGYSPCVVASEEGLAKCFRELLEVDLVILNIESRSENSRHLLESVRQSNPNVKVVLTSDSSDFWNDFSTWLADACIVTSADLSGLKDTVKRFLTPALVS